MRSKLIFPSGGKETKYIWNKSTINDKGVYVWDKNDVLVIDTHYWDKHTINYNTDVKIYNWEKYFPARYRYIWKKYNIETTYYWDKYNAIIMAEDYYEANRYSNAKNIKLYSNVEFNPKYYGATYRTIEDVNYYPSLIFTIYYTEPSNEGTLNKILSKSFTALEILNLVKEINVGSGVSQKYWTNAIGLNDNLIGGDYNNKVNINVEEDNVGFAFIPYKDNGFIVYYSSNYNEVTNHIWVDKEALENGYWIYEDDAAPSNDILPYEYSYNSANIVYTNTPILSSGEKVFIPYSQDTNSLKYYVSSEPIFNNNKSVADGYIYGNIKYQEANVIQGDFIEQVSSTNLSSYPSNGVFDNYWYVYNTSITDKATFIEEVDAANEDAYPQDGIQDGYWYVHTLTETIEATYKWNQYGTTKSDKIINVTGQRAAELTVNQSGLTFYLGDTDNSSYEQAAGFLKPLPNVTYTLTENQSITYNTNDNTRPIGYYQSDEDAISFYYKNSRLKYSSIHEIFYQLETFKEANISKTDLIFIEYDGAYYLITDKTTIYKYSNGDITISNLTKLTFHTDSQQTINLFIGSFFKIGDTTKTVECSEMDYYGGSRTDRYLIPIYIPEARQQTRDNSTLQNYSSNTDINDYYIIDEETSAALIQIWQDIKYHIEYNKGYYYYNGYYYTISPEYELIKNENSTPYTYTSKNRYTYPDNGLLNNKWYEYIGTDIDDYLYLETVSDLNENAYPKDDIQDGYLYKYIGFIQGAETAGDYLEEVTSLNAAEYPQNGIQDGYWYIYNKTVRTFEKGEYLERVEATNEDAYPKDGRYNGYWYVFKGWEDTGRYEGKFIQQIETNNGEDYPTNGILNNYWYKFKGSYEGYKLQITDAEIKGGIEYNQDINPDEDYTVGTVTSAEISFDYDNTNKDIGKYISANECWYYTWQPADNDWRKMGVFYLEDITEIRNKIKVNAYDSVIKTEQYVDSFINKTTYPITLSNFFISLCQFLGVVGIVKDNVVNKDLPLSDNFEGINLTGRQVLQYIAEMAGGYIKANENGELVLQGYAANNIVLDNSKYTKYIKHNYSVQGIQGLIVRTTEDDLGVSAGAASGNLYIIENNPLFYAESTSEIQGAVNNLYKALQNKIYVPAEVELLQDFGINCGDIITIDGDKIYVMSKKLSPSGCVLKCVGNKHRDLKESGLNGEIIALRGKTNELYRDLEETRSTLTDTAEKLRSEIKQTAEEIYFYVEDQDEQLWSKFTIQADSIISQVEDVEKDLSSKIQQTEQSITSQIVEQGKIVTEIRQDLDGIELSYNSENGTASITIGDITVTDLVNGEYVTRTVAGIDLTGYVTFHSLETAGETVINGSNITTGTINADRINMTGAITWGDLSSDVQDAIDAGVSGGDDLPDYIKSTYIDEVSIMSPEIIGGSITQTSGGRTTVIEDTQVLFKVKEDGVSYEVGCIDAYTDGAGTSTSAKSGLAIRSYWDGSGYSGGMKLEANRGITMAAGQDIYFYIPGHQGVALSTILTKLGL